MAFPPGKQAERSGAIWAGDVANLLERGERGALRWDRGERRVRAASFYRPVTLSFTSVFFLCA